MSHFWIYIGADTSKSNWSKVGKTAKGLKGRHTSSQNPGYHIQTAFNIISGDVHKIERELLNYIETLPGVERLRHVSTGSKSECFSVPPSEMANIVEYFIEHNYPSSVNYEALHDRMCRYELNSNAKNQNKPLKLSPNCYRPGNNEVYESDLGGGHFIDHETGKEGYRDEEGNVYWKY
ncbi:hypothetical protein [Pseudoalteromonas maricaloris]|uniref:Uncharacterized protein n=1 Tax=Pseudoalteromonas maricaloris TaxID=184924 RepID=A0A8I2H3U5_9GAMM|nr:hypothetical protein [Pseudoalteromonas maricaloris]NLR21760.1 hypothetical protein [Pseudoalteromonas maricaloris]WOX28298.1 hypothetical protein R5H13_16970 [Pseudoalteromonas maricaloris]